MSRPALPRPVLLPGLTRLWRDRHTLQLGLGSSRAVLVEVANPRAVRLLDLLDGSRSERLVLADAAGVDVRQDEARGLLDALRDAGLVVPAHTLLPATSPARRGTASPRRPGRWPWPRPTCPARRPRCCGDAGPRGCW